MSTNFYARIIPTESEKQELIDAINNDDINRVEELTQALYGTRMDYNGSGKRIHLGKRSCGWKFMWNSNVIRIWDPIACAYQWDYLYPLTKEGITKFVMREDVVITDEYGEVMNGDEFLDMAFNWCVNGLDSKEYQTNPKYDAPHYYCNHDEKQKWRDLGYDAEYYDFYSDGLLFSTSVDFR